MYVQTDAMHCIRALPQAFRRSQPSCRHLSVRALKPLRTNASSPNSNGESSVDSNGSSDSSQEPEALNKTQQLREFFDVRLPKVLTDGTIPKMLRDSFAGQQLAKLRKGEDLLERMEEDAAPEESADSDNEGGAVVEAFKAGSLGFGFSAGGLLFSYYIGVAEELDNMGVLNENSKLAGSSAGSLIAACYHSGLSWERITEGCLALADDCRVHGTRGRLRSVLHTFLDELLPDDIHERCTNKTYVAVTRAFPKPKAMLISEFESRDDLMAALLTSCHIPWWFDSTMFTTFRGKLCYDGGLTNFIPKPPVQHAVRVCCFPSKQMRTLLPIGISPDSFEAWPHPMSRMLSWAFEPGERDVLLEFIAKGRKDARAWAEATGVVDVLSAESGSNGAMKPKDSQQDRVPLPDLAVEGVAQS